MSTPKAKTSSRWRKGVGHHGGGAVAAGGGPLGGVPLHRARAAVALQRREGRLQGYEAPLRLHRVGPARPLSRTRSLRLHRGENSQLCPGRGKLQGYAFPTEVIFSPICPSLLGLWFDLFSDRRHRHIQSLGSWRRAWWKMWKRTGNE